MPRPRLISPSDPKVTRDLLLGGRVTLVQPARGNRAAIDPVLLAAAVPAEAGDHVLELGCGTGAAALCLAARVAGCRVTGVDVQSDLVALARQGAEASGLTNVQFEVHDILELPAGQFDHAMANPPYRRAGSGRVSPDPAKAAATIEGAAGLDSWVLCALGRVRSAGTITFVHHAARGGEVAALLAAGGADVTVFPLAPRRGQAAKRVLVQGVTAGRGHIRTATGLVLHDADGRFTPDAEAIVREGHALAISSS